MIFYNLQAAALLPVLGTSLVSDCALGGVKGAGIDAFWKITVGS